MELWSCLWKPTQCECYPGKRVLNQSWKVDCRVFDYKARGRNSIHVHYSIYSFLLDETLALLILSMILKISGIPLYVNYPIKWKNAVVYVRSSWIIMQVLSKKKKKRLEETRAISTASKSSDSDSNRSMTPFWSLAEWRSNVHICVCLLWTCLFWKYFVFLTS